MIQWNPKPTDAGQLQRSRGTGLAAGREQPVTGSSLHIPKAPCAHMGISEN